MNNNFKAMIAGLLGYSIFGFSFLFSKVALNLASPIVLLSARFTVAFLVMNLILVFTKTTISLKGKPVKKLLAMGLIQPVIYFICEAYGIQMTSASFSGIVIGLVPVAGLLLGVIFLKERCSRFQLICTVTSVAGVALTTTGGLEFSILGFVLLLISVFSNAFFSVISRSVSEEFSPFERTYVMLGLGAVTFILIALIQNRNDFGALALPLTSLDFWISVIYLGVFSSVCAFLLINYALNYLSVGHTLIFSNFTTVISVLAGILILHDAFTSVQIVGIIVIIVSVFGVSYQKKGTVTK